MTSARRPEETTRARRPVAVSASPDGQGRIPGGVGLGCRRAVKKKRYLQRIYGNLLFNTPQTASAGWWRAAAAGSSPPAHLGGRPTRRWQPFSAYPPPHAWRERWGRLPCWTRSRPSTGWTESAAAAAASGARAFPPTVAPTAAGQHGADSRLRIRPRCCRSATQSVRLCWP